MRALTCKLLLVPTLLLPLAAGCEAWETECLREPERCTPRSVAVTPAGALDRTVSDSLSVQIDGPLRETAPRRFQLEDSQGNVLVDLGTSGQAPYQFPLAANQRRCLPDQVGLRVYQLAASLTWESLDKGEQSQVTLDVPTVTFASPLISAAPVSPRSGDQSFNIGGMWIVSNFRATASLIQVLWQYADSGNAGFHNQFRAYEYNPVTRGLAEQPATATPAVLDGGYGWADGHGGKGLVVQKAAAGSLVAFSADSTVDQTPALQASWARFNSNPTGLTYHQALAPLVVAVDTQRTVALIAAVDMNAQPFLAARLPPFDNSTAALLPAPFPALSVSTLVSLEKVTGSDPLIRFLVVDSAGNLTALSYEPVSRVFSADSALAQTVNTALTGSGVTAILALAAGDLNGDGLPDLAVAARDGTATGIRVHFYRNLSSSGQVGFQSSAVSPLGVDLTPLGLSAVAQLSLGDVDGDTQADLVFTSPAVGSTPPQLALLLQTCPFL